MNAARTLDASAEAFLAIGDETTAAMCQRMASDCRNLGMFGQQLYAHWASELAERASLKLAAFNRGRAA